MLPHLIVRRVALRPLSLRGVSNSKQNPNEAIARSEISPPLKQIEFNGKIYNNPWKGELEEGPSPVDRINKWTQEGKWCSQKNRPYFFLKPCHEKNKMWAMYFQMHDHLPIHERGPWDPFINSVVKVMLSLCVLIVFFNIYNLVFPDEWKYRFENNRPKAHHEEHH